MWCNYFALKHKERKICHITDLFLFVLVLTTQIQSAFQKWLTFLEYCCSWSGVLFTNWTLMYTYQKPKGLHDSIQPVLLLSSVTVILRDYKENFCSQSVFKENGDRQGNRLLLYLFMARLQRMPTISVLAVLSKQNTRNMK